MLDLKALRIEKGMTQLQLAEEIRCARTVIANIECGTAQPSIATAKALGEALGVNWWEFFEEEGEPVGTNSIHRSGSSQASQN
jgi:transcriptional regulator with XRE-family HTH domain